MSDKNNKVKYNLKNAIRIKILRFPVGIQGQ